MMMPCNHIWYLWYMYYWRASGASETLSGVTQLKIRDVCLFLYNVWTYIRMSFCTLTLTYFCVCSVFDPVPNFTVKNITKKFFNNVT